MPVAEPIEKSRGRLGPPCLATGGPLSTHQEQAGDMRYLLPQDEKEMPQRGAVDRAAHQRQERLVRPRAGEQPNLVKTRDELREGRRSLACQGFKDFIQHRMEERTGAIPEPVGGTDQWPQGNIPEPAEARQLIAQDLGLPVKLGFIPQVQPLAPAAA